MPIPRYIVCSRSIAVDEKTGFCSIFEIIDKIMLDQQKGELPTGIKGVILEMPFVVTSAWELDLSNGEVYGEEFVFNLSVKADEKEILTKQLPLVFQDGTYIHRFNINLGNIVAALLTYQCDHMVIECSTWKEISEAQKHNQHQYRIAIVRTTSEFFTPSANVSVPPPTPNQPVS